jgi:metal-sulfur cluster biosynthetic enzyme
VGDLLEEVRTALEQVIDPCSAAHGRPLNVWEMGLVRNLDVADGVVTLQLYLTSPVCTMIGKFHEQAEDALLGLPGIDEVVIVPDSGLDWPGMPARAQANRSLPAGIFAKSQDDRR